MSTDPSSNTARRPRASVIVPHYEQPALLADCLESLKAQSLPRDEFEIIVADNNSVCDLSEIQAAHPDVIFLTERRKGAALARNAGMARAGGGAIAFIDADCIAEPRWLEAGLAALQDADLVGGEVIVTAADPADPTPVEAFEKVFAFRQRIYVRRKHFSVTANLFATRAAAEAIGPFRNGVAEDFDWCRRARALGFRLAFNDTSIIRHPARRDWDELTAKWARLTRERWNGFEARGAAARCRWALIAVATALSAAPHAGTVLVSTRLTRMKDRLAALAVLARIRWWRARAMLSLLRRP